MLRYAVHNPLRPQRLVAECIRLGFSTHQASITDSWRAKTSRKKWMYASSVSPLVHCVEKNLPVLGHMLYESGSCSYKELFGLTADFPETFDMYSEDNLKWLQPALKFLEDKASSPRSLMSACRLVISQHLDVRGKRHKDVAQLPLLGSIRDYVMFADLTDPGSRSNMAW